MSNRDSTKRIPLLAQNAVTPLSQNPELKLDWCDHHAATKAVMRWHYSRAMPVSKMNFIGVWENGRFIGALVFGWGANKSIGSAYKLKQTEVCELQRVALDKHQTPVSRIVKIAILILTKKNPGLRLIISYADPDQHHHGGIYQAGNWVYVGAIKTYHFEHNGKTLRPRAYTGHNYGNPKKEKPAGTKKIDSTKHKYLMPLDDRMREQVEQLRKPYPKRNPPPHAQQA